jgi:hypothetical protein
MTGSTPGIIVMIVVVMIVLVAWIMWCSMPTLILSGGVGYLPRTGTTRQTACPAVTRQEQRARAARPARQRHQLQLGRTGEHPPRQRPGSMRAEGESTDSRQRHRPLRVPTGRADRPVPRTGSTRRAAAYALRP